MTKERYLGRKIHNDIFYEALTIGKLKPMFKVINSDIELDVQIRENYLNVYYDGGNIARISSANSIYFDENYFYDNMKNIPSRELNRELKEILKSNRNKLLDKFKAGNFKEYFDDSKDVMDKWFKLNPKPERKEQHQLVIENRYGRSDYTIIDIEYQVSTKSEFACRHIGRNGKVKKPRFDMIAVDKNGILCVIELKKGSGALGGLSGLKEHLDCYNLSIGDKPESFMSEMKNLLIQKQEFSLIDKNLKILGSKPKFIFAYSYATNDKGKEDKIFDRYYKKLAEKIHVIKLKKGYWKLLD